MYGTPHQDTIGDHQHLITTENFPDDKHTRVYFKSTTQAPYSYESEQHHPVQVQTFRAPLVYHKLEQFYNNPQLEDYDGGAQQIHGGYGDESRHSTATEANFATVKQKAVLPYNYHAHQPQRPDYRDGNDYSNAQNNLYKRNSAKRQAIQSRDERMQKFTNLMQRFKARRLVSSKIRVEE